MARSNYKYQPMYVDDLKNYFNKVFKEKKTIKKLKISKRKTIIKWNNFYLVSIHQGKYNTELQQTYNHLGFKFGQFTKTRKPFFFRGKKK